MKNYIQTEIGIDEIDEKSELICGECRWYRPQWGECCYGGGWGCYTDEDTHCQLGFSATWDMVKC